MINYNIKINNFFNSINLINDDITTKVNINYKFSILFDQFTYKQIK